MNSLKNHFKKILFISFLIGLGGGLIYLFSSSSFITIPSQKEQVSLENFNLNQFGTDNNILEKLKGAKSKDEKTSETQSSFLKTDNLTDSLAQSLFEKIKSKNKNGLQEKNGKRAFLTSSPDLISMEVAKNIFHIKPGRTKTLHPKVDDKKIFISSDISKEAQTDYIKKLKLISDKYFSNFRKTTPDILEDISSGNNSSARQLTNIYKNIINECYKIVVPFNWLAFHKVLLSHFYSAEGIYQSLANFKEDPLKTYLALESIPDIQQSADGIQVLLTRGMEKNNLSLK